MQTKEYQTVDKSAWGPGPWQDEPDKKQWVDPATGLPCLIVRNPFGSLCGYVGVSKDHPFFEKGFGDYSNSDQEVRVDNLDVHGGITFSGFCREGGDESTGVCHVVEPGEDDRVWWLGFDCAHAFDLAPGNEIMRKLRAGYYRSDIYRDLAYVTEQVEGLAMQLKVLQPAEK